MALNADVTVRPSCKHWHNGHYESYLALTPDDHVNLFIELMDFGGEDNWEAWGNRVQQEMDQLEASMAPDTSASDSQVAIANVDGTSLPSPVASNLKRKDPTPPSSSSDGKGKTRKNESDAD